MRDDVTVCIPTIPGRENFARRACGSADGQSQVIVHCDQYTPQNRDRAYSTWREAIYRAGTPYVVLLFDDDWLEPGCIDKLRSLMSDGAAYVVGNANIRYPHGDSACNLNWPEPTGYLDSRMVEGRLLDMRLTVSPGCCLFRREEALSCLLVGGIPLLPSVPANAGSDLLMMLLPLLKYPLVGWHREALLNFDAGEQSTTLEALKTESGRAALCDAYDGARRFYLSLRGALCA